MAARQRERPAELVTPFLLSGSLDIPKVGGSRSSMDSTKHSTVDVKKMNSPKKSDPHVALEEEQWKVKTSERQLIREKGSLQKGLRELHHSSNAFHKEKTEEAKDHFNELGSKLSILSKLHHGSYQLSKVHTIDRVNQNKKSTKHIHEEGRTLQIAMTTTQQQYHTILRSMDQVVGEAAELGSRFERQLREKARQHHELGVQLREVGAQLRLEKAKQDKFYKEEERRRKEEAMEKLGHWKDAQAVTTTLQTQLKIYEKEFLDSSRDHAKAVRGKKDRTSLQVREFERKIQGVDVQLRKVADKQRNIVKNKSHLSNQEVVAENDRRVQEHISKAQGHIEQRQIKTNKWKPKLQLLARENERRLEKMEKTLLYEDVAKAGETESVLFRKMRGLESDTRKQGQVLASKRAALEREGQRGRIMAQNHLRAINENENQLAEEVAKEEAALRQLVVQRDDAVTEYRQHQTSLKDAMKMFQTMTSKDN